MPAAVQTTYEQLRINIDVHVVDPQGGLDAETMQGDVLPFSTVMEGNAGMQRRSTIPSTRTCYDDGKYCR
jgi:hypothetical protein